MLTGGFILTEEYKRYNLMIVLRYLLMMGTKIIVTMVAFLSSSVNRFLTN